MKIDFRKQMHKEKLQKEKQERELAKSYRKKGYDCSVIAVIMSVPESYVRYLLRDKGDTK